jgi:hypothetical protein
VGDAGGCGRPAVAVASPGLEEAAVLKSTVHREL